MRGIWSSEKSDQKFMSNALNDFGECIEKHIKELSNIIIPTTQNGKYEQVICNIKGLRLSLNKNKYWDTTYKLSSGDSINNELKRQTTQQLIDNCKLSVQLEEGYSRIMYTFINYNNKTGLLYKIGLCTFWDIYNNQNLKKMSQFAPYTRHDILMHFYKEYTSKDGGETKFHFNQSKIDEICKNHTYIIRKKETTKNKRLSKSI